MEGERLKTVKARHAGRESDGEMHGKRRRLYASENRFLMLLDRVRFECRFSRRPPPPD
jgi:hypothetical protein